MTALAPRPSPRAPRPQPVLAPLSESAVFLTLTIAGGLIFVPSQEFVDDPPPRPDR